MNNTELMSAEMSGKKGGEYLESIGKFDLSKLSKSEWMSFLEIICGEYLILRDESRLLPSEIPF